MAKPNFTLNKEWAEKQLAVRAQSDGGSKDGLFWDKMPKVGSFSFRLLPPDPATGKLGLVEGNHWNIPGVKGTLPSLMVTWPDMLDGSEDPIAEALRETENTIPKDKWEGMQPSIRTVLLITDVQGELGSGKKYKPDDIVVLTPGGDFTFRWVLSTLMDPDTTAFIDPYRGNRIKIGREQKDSKWERKILPAAGPIGGSDEVADAILEKYAALEFYTKYFQYPDAAGITEIQKGADAIRAMAGATKAQSNDKLKNVRDTLSGEKAAREVQEQAKTNVVKQEESAPADEKPDASSEKVADPKPERTQEETVSEVREATQAVLNNKPANAPDCFGNSEVYDGGSARCLQCPFEMDCSSSM